MIIITLISISAILALSILSSITDVRIHKVRNKHIVVFAALGLALQVGAVVLDSSLLLILLENLLLAIAIAIAFYAVKIWAAGDAKLFATMILLFPFNMMINVLGTAFASLVVLGFTFTIAMGFVVVESAVLFLRDVFSHNLEKKTTGRRLPTKAAILSWISAYIVIDLADSLLRLIGHNRIYHDPYFLIIFNLLLANAFISLIKGSRWKMIVSGSALAVRIVLTILHVLPLPSFSLWTILIITLLLLFRRFTGRYDYRAIPTENVAEGQVLAQSTIAVFLLSKAENLPSYSDESTRCRLTSEEANAIRKWGLTKSGRKTIVIVRNIPFAPFIFAGVLVCIAICAVM